MGLSFGGAFNSSSKKITPTTTSTVTGAAEGAFGDINGSLQISQNTTTLNLGQKSKVTLTDAGAVAGGLTVAGAAVDMAETVSRAAIEAGKETAGDALAFASDAIARSQQQAQAATENALESIQSAATDDTAETLQTLIKAAAWVVAGLALVYILKESKR